MDERDLRALLSNRERLSWLMCADKLREYKRGRESKMPVDGGIKKDGRP